MPLDSVCDLLNFRIRIDFFQDIRRNEEVLIFRMGKPFNPLLGETYQLEQEHFKIVCEQVRVWTNLQKFPK